MVSLGGRRDREPAKPAERADSLTQPGTAVRAWASAAGSDTLVFVHVRPGAKRSAIAGEHGARLKIAIKAPPVDGKANAALIEFLAEVLRRPRRQVTLESGLAHRDKTVRIEAATPGEIVGALLALVSGRAD